MARWVNELVIHCSDSPNGRPDTIWDIDDWHKERKFQRSEAMRLKYRPELVAVGYHAVIHVDGTIALGRHTSEVGAHVLGHNEHSIGVCLIGTDAFTMDQWDALKLVCSAMEALFPATVILGHRQYPYVSKKCPGFDVETWLRNSRYPLKEHVYGA